MRKFLVALSCVVAACSGAPPAPDAAGMVDDGPVAAQLPAPPPAGAAPAAKTDLYFRTLGKVGDPPVIFLHGGPGASSSGFEASGAQLLAERGFFVVTYDQRGGTRSPRQPSPDGYSFKTSSDDLATLIASLDVKDPVLLANSFGGSVALKFMEAHPGVAKATILIGSPMNWPRTHWTCIERARESYRRRLSIGSVRDMDALKSRMFPNELRGPFTYPVEDVELVIKALNETLLFYPDLPSFNALKTYGRFALAPEVLTTINGDVGRGYHANDQVGHLDVTPLLAKLSADVYGIYGTDDRIFDDEQLATIRSTITTDHFTQLRGAGHFPFIDQPEVFVDAVVTHIAKMR